MIVIVSNKWDLTVDFVVLKLRARNYPFARLNTEDLPKGSASVFLPNFEITFSHRDTVINFADVRVVWARRPGYVFDDVLREDRPSVAVQSFVEQQWRAWRGGIEALRGIRWVNPLQAEERAENKILQLRTAFDCGFHIPDTVFTNCGKLVRDFLKKHDGRVVTKALQAPLLEEPEGDSFVFTSSLDKLEPQDDAALRIAPVIVQERIYPKTDYRITVVGEDVFPVRIFSKDGEVALDWRTQKVGLEFDLCLLPAELVSRCRALVKALDLRFGAIDLVESNGKFFFLEINPNGEWGWLQKTVGVPIADALADLLINLASEAANA